MMEFSPCTDILLGKPVLELNIRVLMLDWNLTKDIHDFFYITYVSESSFKC